MRQAPFIQKLISGLALAFLLVMTGPVLAAGIPAAAQAPAANLQAQGSAAADMAAANQITATVAGHVVDEEGVGIEGVRVELEAQGNRRALTFLSTDATGAFRFLDRPVGLYALRAVIVVPRGNQKTLDHQGNVLEPPAAMQDARVDVTLQSLHAHGNYEIRLRRYHRIHGRMLNALGQPLGIGQAQVTFRRVDGGSIRRGTGSEGTLNPDANGEVDASTIYSGEYVFVPTARGLNFYPTEQRVTVRGVAPIELPVFQAAGGGARALRGQVLENVIGLNGMQATLRGLRGVPVELIARNGNQPRQVMSRATTGDNGVYEFTGLASGDYGVRTAMPDIVRPQYRNAGDVFLSVDVRQQDVRYANITVRRNIDRTITSLRALDVQPQGQSARAILSIETRNVLNEQGLPVLEAEHTRAQVHFFLGTGQPQQPAFYQRLLADRGNAALAELQPALTLPFPSAGNTQQHEVTLPADYANKFIVAVTENEAVRGNDYFSNERNRANEVQIVELEKIYDIFIRRVRLDTECEQWTEQLGGGAPVLRARCRAANPVLGIENSGLWASPAGCHFADDEYSRIDAAVPSGGMANLSNIEGQGSSVDTPYALNEQWAKNFEIVCPAAPGLRDAGLANNRTSCSGRFVALPENDDGSGSSGMCSGSIERVGGHENAALEVRRVDRLSPNAPGCFVIQCDNGVATGGGEMLPEAPSSPYQREQAAGNAGANSPQRARNGALDVTQNQNLLQRDQNVVDAGMGAAGPVLNGIHGVVLDQENRAVVGATVKLLRQGEADSRTQTLTDDSGHFSFNQIEAGHYTVRVQHGVMPGNQNRYMDGAGNGLDAPRGNKGAGVGAAKGGPAGGVRGAQAPQVDYAAAPSASADVMFEGAARAQNVELRVHRLLRVSGRIIAQLQRQGGGAREEIPIHATAQLVKDGVVVASGVTSNNSFYHMADQEAGRYTLRAVDLSRRYRFDQQDLPFDLSLGHQEAPLIVGAAAATYDVSGTVRQRLPNRTPGAAMGAFPIGLYPIGREQFEPLFQQQTTAEGFFDFKGVPPGFYTFRAVGLPVEIDIQSRDLEVDGHERALSILVNSGADLAITNVQVGDNDITAGYVNNKVRARVQVTTQYQGAPAHAPPLSLQTEICWAEGKLAAGGPRQAGCLPGSTRLYRGALPYGPAATTQAVDVELPRNFPLGHVVAKVDPQGSSDSSPGNNAFAAPLPRKKYDLAIDLNETGVRTLCVEKIYRLGGRNHEQVNSYFCAPGSIHGGVVNTGPWETPPTCWIDGRNQSLQAGQMVDVRVFGGDEAPGAEWVERYSQNGYPVRNINIDMHCDDHPEYEQKGPASERVSCVYAFDPARDDGYQPCSPEIVATQNIDANSTAQMDAARLHRNGCFAIGCGPFGHPPDMPNAGGEVGANYNGHAVIIEENQNENADSGFSLDCPRDENGNCRVEGMGNNNRPAAGLAPVQTAGFAFTGAGAVALRTEKVVTGGFAFAGSGAKAVPATQAVQTTGFVLTGMGAVLVPRTQVVPTAGFAFSGASGALQKKTMRTDGFAFTGPVGEDMLPDVSVSGVYKSRTPAATKTYGRFEVLDFKLTQVKPLARAGGNISPFVLNDVKNEINPQAAIERQNAANRNNNNSNNGRNNNNGGSGGSGGTATNGSCGSAHNSLTTLPPAMASRCTAGTPSDVTGSQTFDYTYTWTCTGSGGGSTASCSAKNATTCTAWATSSFTAQAIVDVDGLTTSPCTVDSNSTSGANFELLLQTHSVSTIKVLGLNGGSVTLDGGGDFMIGGFGGWSTARTATVTKTGRTYEVVLRVEMNTHSQFRVSIDSVTRTQ